MASGKVGRFFLKPRNIAVLTGSILTIKLLPDFFPKHTTRPFIEAYQNGKICNLQDSQLEEFKEVCRALGVVKADKYHTFVTGRWQIGASGSPWLPNGVHFAIPIHFVDNPETSSLNLKGKSGAMKEGKLFKESFKLSKSARQFALAVETARIESGLPILKACLLPLYFLMGYATSFAILPTLNFLPLPVAILAIGSVYFMCYRFSIGRINESIDFSMDKKVANLSPEYANGGLEYVEKILQRNIALRGLLENGKKRFSYYGNENEGVFYSAHARLTERKDAIKTIVDDNTKCPIE
ncbi:transmembrane protein 177-like [Antedon mediterranea]|uniref:transmembrane protein 177-like n=1 Tax=Antedon mediterranea TaxID=105859 RepID=UPI003AF4E7F6